MKLHFNVQPLCYQRQIYHLFSRALTVYLNGSVFDPHHHKNKTKTHKKGNHMRQLLVLVEMDSDTTFDFGSYNLITVKFKCYLSRLFCLLVFVLQFSSLSVYLHAQDPTLRLHSCLVSPLNFEPNPLPLYSSFTVVINRLQTVTFRNENSFRVNL